jgi:hypothetical protein
VSFLHWFCLLSQNSHQNLSSFSGPDHKIPLSAREVSEFVTALQDESSAALVAPIRAATAAGDEKLAKCLKKQRLPAVTFSGTFSRRKKDGLEQYSHLVTMDFDHLPNPEITRTSLQSDPCVLLAFVSASGTGTKALVRVNTGPERHLEAWQAAADHFRDQHGLTADTSGTDINRLCFASYDASPAWNPDATPLPVPEAPELPVVPEQTPRSYVLKDTATAPSIERDDELPEILREDVRDMLAAVASRGRPDYASWLKVINSTRAALNDDADALAMLKAAFPEEKPLEYEEKFAHPCGSIGAGSLVHLAKDAGFDWKGRLSERRRAQRAKEPLGKFSACKAWGIRPHRCRSPL